MTKFKATISFRDVLIPAKEKDGGVIRHTVEDSSTNARNLEVIRLFEKGEYRVSSVTEKISKQNGRTEINFDVNFYSNFHSDNIESTIEKFGEVFNFHSIQEVKTK